jgi:DNA topoisomerase I
MSKSLIIVESPAKIKTLKNFLGADYLIEASMGHVRDLPKTKLGVDPEKNFEPEYLNIPDRKAVITKLKKAAKEVDTIYLASDPDREGEAIAWHLQEVLKAKDAKRIRFNEITSSAVTESLKHAQTLNMDLVNAQQARRVLDRLVGYKLSPLLWKKIKRNLSAGRVQSVAVRLICEREREILAFIPVEYWSIEADLTPTDKAHSFRAKLASCDGKKCEIANKEQADKILAALEGAKYKVESIKKTQKRRNAPVPFITSTLQQEASRKLNFGARKTMTVAQQLYEGVELGEKGSVGLITYMRTDSTRIAKEAQDEARNYIAANFGSGYAPATARQVSKKGAQDAHEAIRPTSVFRHPDAIKEFLSYDQARLYKLIWQRFLASQMSPAVFDVVTVDISANKMTFRATGSTVKFAGFMKVYTEGKDEDKIKDEEELPPLPEMKEGETLKLISLIPDQHFTEPPPRFSEATLVKALEEDGIGRPSTYAAIISTIQDRKYVALEAKRFIPTELGFVVNDQLVKHFPDILNVEFTAGVESNLDKVEEGKLNWVKLLRDFYTPFDKDLQEASEKMERVKMQPKESDQKCPNCGKVLLIREGRFGEFLGCSGYPDCKTTMPLTKKIEIKCPVCLDGDIVEKISKKKKVFYGCSKYPDCAFVTWLKPTSKRCPQCDSLLGEKRFKGRLVGYGCTNTDCDYIKYRGKNAEADGDKDEKPDVAELVKE